MNTERITNVVLVCLALYWPLDAYWPMSTWQTSTTEKGSTSLDNDVFWRFVLWEFISKHFFWSNFTNRSMSVHDIGMC